MGLLGRTSLEGLDRFSAFQRRRELGRLRRALWKQERALRVLDGHARRGGLLALTTDRILWVPDQAWGGIRALSLREVTGIRVAADGDRGVLTVESDRLALAVARLDGAGATALADEARSLARDLGNSRISTRSGPGAPPRAVEADADDPGVQAKLERLARMHQRGSMTTEEYRIAREQVHRQGGGGSDLPRPAAAWWRRW